MHHAEAELPLGYYEQYEVAFVQIFLFYYVQQLRLVAHPISHKFTKLNSKFNTPSQKRY